MTRGTSFRVRVAEVAITLFLLGGVVSHFARAQNAVGSGDSKSVAAVTPAEAEPEYKNWIEFGFGGTAVEGDEAQFEQEHRIPGEQVFGGITDLHFEETIGKDVQMTLDGHAIFDTNDYGLRFNISKAKLGY